jgi:hypothetical protein
MRGITGAAVAGVLLIPAAPVSAGTQPGSDEDSAIAVYHGRRIRMADGWQGAQACAVVTDTDIRCYDSEAELKEDLGIAAVEHVATADALTAAASCGGSSVYLRLYDDIGFNGATLWRHQTTDWDNLSPYGFDNRMESWINDKSCTTIVADGTSGSGDVLGLAANSSSSNVGLTWKNRASSIYVLP